MIITLNIPLEISDMRHLWKEFYEQVLSVKGTQIKLTENLSEEKRNQVIDWIQAKGYVVKSTAMPTG